MDQVVVNRRISIPKSNIMIISNIIEGASNSSIAIGYGKWDAGSGSRHYYYLIIR